MRMMAKMAENVMSWEAWQASREAKRANLRRLGLDAPSRRETDYGTSGRRLRKAFGGERVPEAESKSEEVKVKKCGGGHPSNLQPLLAHWPGGLTIVYGGEGYRVPDHEWTRRLLAKCGGLLRVTSANMSGQRAATDAEAALADVGLSADLVVDDGVSKGGVASTVVKIGEDGTVTVLREGPVKVV